ncbi:MAG: PP2C family protein-serine/threonine phosphatase [Butyrivibrio sp.]|nr:PP2C family protein-serine/threonine phosphatase [Butyrivibrio sp.]
MKTTNHIRFYNSLLFKAGILVFVVLSMSIVIGTIDTYFQVMNEEKKNALDLTEQISILVTQIGSNEEATEWICDYWEANYESMDFLTMDEAGDTEKAEEWRENHNEIWQDFVDNQTHITPEYFEKMDPESQLLLAESLYMFVESTIELVCGYHKETNERNVKYAIFKYIGDDKAFVYFGSDPEEGREAALGRIIPLTLSKHPIISRMIDTGEVPDTTERVTSSTDGIEYLYAAWPITINGSSKAITGVQYPWSETKTNLLKRIFRFGRRILLYMIFADIFLLIFLEITFFVPVRNLREHAREFATNKDSSLVEKGLKSINRRNDEVGSLSNDITDLTKEVDRHIKEIYTLANEKAAVSAALSLASSIQQQALPGAVPVFEGKNVFDLYAYMKPALDVSGDFYDYYKIDEDHLALVIADVSDKGISAAMYMMQTQTMIQTLSMAEGSLRHPKDLFNVINDRLSSKSPIGMFVTVWMGILELSTGKLSCANAGHEYPAIYRVGNSKNREDGFTLMKVPHSPPLAAYPGLSFSAEDVVLEKGDVFFIYTDGVTDANNKDEELFGEERMVMALNKYRDRPAQEIVEGVRDEIVNFMDDNVQFDDITMMCIRYL